MDRVSSSRSISRSLSLSLSLSFSCDTLGSNQELTLAIKSTIPLEIPNVRSTLSHSQERDDVSMQEYHQGSNLSMRTGSFWVMKQPASAEEGRGE
jgi:outer membrane usher protein FimD/PapC